jgi:hypothetical protein
MAKAQPKTGSIVEITFDDHCEGGTDVMECTVWGKVLAVTPKAYTVQTWESHGSDDEYNRSTFNIVKRAIREIKTLTPRR